MANSIRIYGHGGSDRLKWESHEIAPPGPDEVRIDQAFVGLNFIDVYQRTGLYPVNAFPAIIGLEASGVISATGANVSHLKTGDRVAYAAPPMGAYTDQRNMPAAQVVRLPESIELDTAAAMMLQGLTVQYLIRQTYPVKAGQTVLLHAAAGGVGLIASQWLKHLGATVIGTVGSDEKAALAQAHGCDHTILYQTEDVAAMVRDLTDGNGVPVVYDSVGQATLESSLDSLAPRGLLVSFGNASGPVENFNLGILAQKGSLYVTRPTLMSYIADPADLQQMAEELFEVVGSGAVSIQINQRYALADAATAHDDLEARKTTGSTILSV